jgi:hypothetical protein
MPPIAGNVVGEEYRIGATFGGDLKCCAVPGVIIAVFAAINPRRQHHAQFGHAGDEGVLPQYV